MEYQKHKTQNILIITALIISFVLILLLEPFSLLLSNYWSILVSPSILLTDYLAVGGLSATLLNVLTTLIFNLILIRTLKLNFTGPIFAVLMTIVGFSFFGKNVINAIPIYMGVYIYAKATKTQYKDHIIVLLLSSGISPVVSYIFFGMGLNYIISIPLGVFTGGLIGFILPAFNKHAFKFHQGFNLYSTGFSMGVIAMIITATMYSLGYPVQTEALISYQYHSVLFWGLFILSIFFMGISFFYEKKPYQNYPKLIKASGQLVSDFYLDYGKGTSLFNVGIMGLISLFMVLVLKIQISGPIAGAIFTIMGFATFGKHPLNSIPVMMGAILAYWLFMIIDPTKIGEGTRLALFFVTGLAPVAGKFGIFPGIIAGFIHLLIVPFSLSFQGGFDLYNNGFAAGFIAAVTVPIFDLFIHTKHIRQKKE